MSSQETSIQSANQDVPPTTDAEKLEISDDKFQPKREIRGWKWFLVCLGLYATAILYGLDTTIVADVQAAVIETFGEIDKLGWMGIGFPLGSVATILPLGVSYGIFNIKWLYIGSIILFEGGSALCGGAPTMNALIAGRVIAGVGGAGMYLGYVS
jgi:MFS family permease